MSKTRMPAPPNSRSLRMPGAATYRRCRSSALGSAARRPAGATTGASKASRRPRTLQVLHLAIRSIVRTPLQAGSLPRASAGPAYGLAGGKQPVAATDEADHRDWTRREGSFFEVRAVLVARRLVGPYDRLDQAGVNGSCGLFLRASASSSGREWR